MVLDHHEKGTTNKYYWEDYIRNRLFEGDILLTEEQKNGILNKINNWYSSPPFDLTAKYWPKGVVPINIDYEVKLRPKAMKAIYEAIEYYHRNTCIRFELI